ncbi:PREDICTED: probable palmitoyltransferase ZDHHC24 isoform X2 [Priapulus caudatus]|uniref:Palmitoyltransferase n=1 Tax=Priapulus caudatus TaxID=37621 RepID=A0ABM1EBV0_PRICU|nr:PREDICTED: probable palmitoyltransferase ZDHHC24 isoform X2 [Priapulus caudatus]
MFLCSFMFVPVLIGVDFLFRNSSIIVFKVQGTTVALVTVMAYRRNILPKVASDWIPFVGCILLILTSYLFEMLFIIPIIYPAGHTMTYVHFCALTFIVANILGNFLMLVLVDVSSTGMFLPTVLKPEWRYCYECEQNSPPRSHHCSLCNTCILRHDHHCPFTGGCIGHANVRYYVAFLFYVAVGALYANVMNVDYVVEELGGLTLANVFMMVLPFFAWIAGYCRGWALFVSFMTAASLAALLYDGFLLVYHAVLVAHGQTTHESARKNRLYDLGLGRNLEQVFGMNWKLAWLFPLVPSPLPGDGLEFQTRKLPMETSKTL